ncbi:MAG: Serine-type D-Ala-D-Ala carboxypeptidase [Firmicutes bacterium]|nr:Serine-type D-Ala-D-Ala carboxypeptidase [Bacillota bacterium]
MIRKGFIIFLIISFIFPQFALGATKQTANPDLSSKAAIVMEASTGKVLFAYNAEVRNFPASTTKMMTLLTALENGNMNEIVTTSQNAAGVEGSSLWLSPGEKLKLVELLYGMMLISGNDATVAVAEHISGTTDAFARLMTQKAHAIGAVHTNFTNTSGLPDPNHYTTAHDLAKIAAYGFRNPLFAQIVSTKHAVIPWAGKNFGRDLYNENKMLWNYDGANGVKTGYTEAAGPCLVSSAKRGNIQLVAVVLDSNRMWLDSKALLDYGFSKIETQLLYRQSEVIKSIRVKDGVDDFLPLAVAEDVVLPVSLGDREDFTAIVEAPQKYSAPISAGQPIGSIKLLYRGQTYGSVDLLAAQTIERKSLFGKLWTSLWNVVTFVMQKIA